MQQTLDDVVRALRVIHRADCNHVFLDGRAGDIGDNAHAPIRREGRAARKKKGSGQHQRRTLVAEENLMRRHATNYLHDVLLMLVLGFR